MPRGELATPSVIAVQDSRDDAEYCRLRWRLFDGVKRYYFSRRQRSLVARIISLLIIFMTAIIDVAKAWPAHHDEPAE